MLRSQNSRSIIFVYSVYWVRGKYLKYASRIVLNKNFLCTIVLNKPQKQRKSVDVLVVQKFPITIIKKTKITVFFSSNYGVVCSWCDESL